jgi:CRP-like cAMP-binding protein
MHRREPVALAMLRHVSLFRTCDESQLSQVAMLLKEQHYRKGDVIFYQGEPGGCLYIIASGRVRIYLANQEGREVTIRIYGVGNHFGEFSVLDGAPRSASTAALGKVTVFVLYRDEFLRLLRGNFALVERMLANLTERLRYTTTFSENLIFLNTPQRVVAMLLQLAEFESQPQEPLRVKITQHDLAALVCATRESVNQALQELARQDLLRIERGAVVLLNVDELQRIIRTG